jgi:signal peptidase II
MTRLRRPTLASLAIAAVVVVVDQLVKALVSGWIGPRADRHNAWFAGDWLGFAYAENRGVAFGLLQRASTAALLLMAVAILTAIAAFIRIWRENVGVTLGGGLVIGGAIGNVLDRARFGFVRDFVAIGPWPSFNVADTAVTCGVIGILIGMMASNGGGARSPEGTPRASKRMAESRE